MVLHCDIRRVREGDDGEKARNFKLEPSVSYHPSFPVHDDRVKITRTRLSRQRWRLDRIVEYDLGFGLGLRRSFGRRRRRGKSILEGRRGPRR